MVEQSPVLRNARLGLEVVGVQRSRGCRPSMWAPQSSSLKVMFWPHVCEIKCSEMKLQNFNAKGSQFRPEGCQEPLECAHNGRFYAMEWRS